MHKCNPIESNTVPGFFEIPGFSNYLVSPIGEVINIKSMKMLKGSYNPAGYFNLRITGDNKKCLTWGRHRLLAFVFKYPGKDISKLVVNHENGIKGHDCLSNLEWTDNKGNVEHAGRNGLTKHCLPILVKDCLTDEIKEYPSIIECSRELKMSKFAILHRVRIGDTRVFPEKKQYRLLSAKEPWYVPKKIELEILKNGTKKSILVKHLLTGKVDKYARLQDLAMRLDVSPSVFSKWMKLPNQPVLPGFIQLKWEHDDSPWREVEDIHFDLEQMTGQRCVVITSSKTGIEKVFISAITCALYTGISATSLDYRLKTNDSVIFNDGYRYRYKYQKQKSEQVETLV